MVGDGTSLGCEIWIKDERAGKERWWKLGVFTLTAANGGVAASSIAGALHFLRITANTGNVKNYSIALR